MNRPLHLLAVCFCAGLLGALLSGLLLGLAGKFGAFTLVGVHLAPQLKPAWFYPRLVWGGLWGLPECPTRAHADAVLRYLGLAHESLRVRVVPHGRDIAYPSRTSLARSELVPRVFGPTVADVGSAAPRSASSAR